MTRHSRTLILFALLALLATAALAQHRGHGPGHGPWRGHGPGHGGDGAPFARMLDQLDLTDEQREQVEQRIAERHQTNQGLMEQIRERRQGGRPKRCVGMKAPARDRNLGSRPLTVLLTWVSR